MNTLQKYIFKHSLSSAMKTTAPSMKLVANVSQRGFYYPHQSGHLQQEVRLNLNSHSLMSWLRESSSVWVRDLESKWMRELT